MLAPCWPPRITGAFGVPVQEKGEGIVKIAIVREQAEGERRVAATPETVKKFKALGADVAIEAGAGLTASIADADYAAAGATVADRAATVVGADILLGVQGPSPQAQIGFRTQRREAT